MEKTYKHILKELGLNIGQIIAFEELDDKVINVIPADMETQLGQGMEAELFLQSGQYPYWKEEAEELADYVYFELVELADDPIESKIKII